MNKMAARVHKTYIQLYKCMLKYISVYLLCTLQKLIVKTTVLFHLTILKYGLKQPISRQNNFDGLIGERSEPLWILITESILVLAAYF